MTMTEPTGTARAVIEAKRGPCQVDRVYAVEGIEVRAASGENDTTVEFYGHAAVTDKPYEMYGGPDNGGWMEIVDRGAFKRTLDHNPDVAFLLNHTGMSLARTKPGTMTLREDKVGLAVKATLDRRQSVVNDIVIAMERGDLDEMSFAFRIVKQRWLDADGGEVPWWDLSGIERHIEEVDIHKGDVSVVNYGASPTTDAELRSLADTAREVYDGRGTTDVADVRATIEYLSTLLPTEAAAEQPDQALEAAKVELEARTRRLNAARAQD